MDDLDGDSDTNDVTNINVDSLAAQVNYLRDEAPSHIRRRTPLTQHPTTPFGDKIHTKTSPSPHRSRHHRHAVNRHQLSNNYKSSTYSRAEQQQYLQEIRHSPQDTQKEASPQLNIDDGTRSQSAQFLAEGKPHEVRVPVASTKYSKRKRKVTNIEAGLELSGETVTDTIQ